MTPEIFSASASGYPDANTLQPFHPTVWPVLDALGLSEYELRNRHLGIGGSDANVILSGHDDRVLRLWREKRGEVQPANLSAALPVMLGTWTEDFNRQWFETQTGYAVSNAGMVAISADHSWRRATLDGVVSEKMSIWEAKHVNAFAKPDEVLAKYMPQLQHNMAVMGLDNAILSVIYGNHKWEVCDVAADWLYQDELFHAEARFWECVRHGTPPVVVAPPRPPRPTAVREVSFEGRNAWAAAASDWLGNRKAAQLHATATNALKALVEDDVSRAHGHGIEAKRSKAGAITIRELRS